MTETADVVHDIHYTAPLYRKAEAARIIDVPSQTFRNWALGYAFKRLDGSVIVSEALVTTAESPTMGHPTIPFVGLAEAYMLAAFRKAGVPMARIRPAIRWLEGHIGLPQALASERLKTDGAEVLWDFGRRSHDFADREMVDGLVVARSGQQVFRPMVRDYLRRIDYENGWTRAIELPRYEDVRVTVDPWMNGGQPTVARRGVRVADVVSRLKAGESTEELAYDYDLSVPDVEALRRAA